MYKVVAAKSFEEDLSKLDAPVRRRIFDKIKFLAENPEFIKKVRYAPKDLQGLCKYRIGPWRILFWADHKNNVLILYGVDHRDRIYKNLR